MGGWGLTSNNRMQTDGHVPCLRKGRAPGLTKRYTYGKGVEKTVIHCSCGRRVAGDVWLRGECGNRRGDQFSQGV